MAIELKVPSPGESISEVEIARWFVSDGDRVVKDQEVGEVESEKATLPLLAPSAGQIRILKDAGETVPVGTVVCTIDPSALPAGVAANQEDKKPAVQATKEVKSDTPVAELKADIDLEPAKIKVSPLARKMMEEHGLEPNQVLAGLKRLSGKDVETYLQSVQSESVVSHTKELSRAEERMRLSNLRKKLSQRLVAVKNETAMLTTFNEADLSELMRLRKSWQEAFTKTHGIKLGIMSFFTRAAALALSDFPNLNSRIEGEELITPAYCDIGIAVQTPKGLMVPVIRNAESIGLAEIEKAIASLAEKARNNRLSMEDMSGGTFTITNGGVFGSMMSTPIINPPQAAILGMHNIMDRPVVRDGQIVIRPMMYLALSYDHRIIDGKDSVGFLVRIKEYIEKPERMLPGNFNAEKVLLGLE